MTLRGQQLDIFSTITPEEPLVVAQRPEAAAPGPYDVPYESADLPPDDGRPAVTGGPTRRQIVALPLPANQAYWTLKKLPAWQKISMADLAERCGASSIHAIPEIIKQVRTLPGVRVMESHLGHDGPQYWMEIDAKPLP